MRKKISCLIFLLLCMLNGCISFVLLSISLIIMGFAPFRWQDLLIGAVLITSMLCGYAALSMCAVRWGKQLNGKYGIPLLSGNLVSIGVTILFFVAVT